MTDHGPEHIGPRPLAGYVMRNYDHAIVVLRNSRVSQRISLRKAAADAGTSGASLSEWERGLHVAQAPALFDLAYALGYDLALIPREDAASAPMFGHPTASDIATVLAVVDAPYRPGLEVRFEEDTNA